MQVKAEVDDSLWEEVTRKSQQSDENEIIIAAIKALIEMTPEPPLPKPEPLIPAEAPPPALLPPPIASPSQSKFFGQFMISRGIIDETQFNEAIKQVQREHGRVGEIAVDKGFLSSQQAKELNRLQHSEDMPFGALAVERDLLTHHQLEEILKTQTTQGLRIGDAIKQLGFATEEAIESAFRDFEKEAEIEAKTEHPILHPDLFGIREAELLVDTFPKIVMRLTGLPSKLSRGIPFNPKVMWDCTAALTFGTSRNFRVLLTVNEDLANAMLRKLFGDDVAESDMAPEFDDAVGEFLTIVVAAVIRDLQQEGTKAELGKPECIIESPSNGYAFSLNSTEGNGTLLIIPEAV